MQISLCCFCKTIN